MIKEAALRVCLSFPVPRGRQGHPRGKDLLGHVEVQLIHRWSGLIIDYSSGGTAGSPPGYGFAWT